MPECEFEIVAITATGRERQAWELPENVRSVRVIPLWGGSRPSPQSRGRLASFRFGDARASLAGDPTDPALRECVEAFGLALTESDLPAAKTAFLPALRGWAELALSHDVEAALLSPFFIGLLMKRWSEGPLVGNWSGRGGGLPTVADAVTATRLLAHALRPLQYQPPGVDLVHLVANGIAGLSGMAAKWRYGTPIVLSEHGVYLRERYLSFGGTAYSYAVKWLLLRFHRVLAGAVYTEADLVAPGNIYNRRWEVWDGVPDSVIHTVYNGVDPEEFALADGEPDVPTISWAGRIDPIKDLVTLLRAFAIVHEEMPQARLRIFGGTPAGNEGYRDDLVALAEELGLGESATFEGRVEVIQDAYAAGNLVALTSISEGFPYTVIEAMSCGRATVSTNVGGVAEAVGESGLVVPPRNPEAFAQACLLLLRDAQQRRIYAERARARVVELFTLEQSLNAFRRIYQGIAQPQAMAGATV